MADKLMIEKLDQMVSRIPDVEVKISDPDLVKDHKKYKQVMQEYSHLCDIRDEYDKFKQSSSELVDSKELFDNEKDHEMKEMIREEMKELGGSIKEMEQTLHMLLVPKDPLDGKDIIMEIRAGTGGEEAALFAADLYRMYTRYAEEQKWKFEIIQTSETGIGGFKEISFSISGKSVYGNLRYESGAHRVQRVPETESGGRIHTSAVTVAVLPEAEETDIQIKNEDLRIDVFRSSGPGGQCVNTTDSAVRITHLPTGVVVTCQDEKSQIKNKAKAMRVLRARILEAEELKKHEERAEVRKNQVGSGDRSERIRTYNYPQNRLTDHRINLTLYKLDAIMQGDLTEVLNALKVTAQEELMTN